MTKMRLFVAMMMTLALAFTLSACSACKPTPEKEKEYFKAKVDKLQVMADKNPQHKLSIELKIKEFNEEAGKAANELEKLQALNRRVDAYIAEIEKTVAAPVATPTNPTQPGGKIGAGVPGTGMGTGALMPGTDPNMGGMGAQPGGKLGGGTAAPMPGTDPGMGGMGGQPGGKLGGGTMPPAPVPAPTPAPAGGFGGQ